jgi:hypothetical protein
MWLTEEKANEKACPIFALAFFLTDGKLIDDACQGTRCVWWRWADQPGVHGRKRVGYCGHAGKPEGIPPIIKNLPPEESEIIYRSHAGKPEEPQGGAG